MTQSNVLNIGVGPMTKAALEHFKQLQATTQPVGITCALEGGVRTWAQSRERLEVTHEFVE